MGGVLRIDEEAKETMIIFMITIQLLASPTPLSSRLNALEERPSAMRGLITRAIIPKPAEYSAVVQVLQNIIQSPDETLGDKIYAIRALGTLESGNTVLASYIPAHFEDESARVLGIESAQALAKFAPPNIMASWLTHTDPEIRAIAARVGGNAEVLCERLKSDPWPIVRRAAVLGLSASSEPSRCIEIGLNDKVSAVRLASVEVIGESHALLSPTKRTLVRDRLHTLIKDSRQSNQIREQIMQTLGKMGECSAAASALNVYLQSGGLKPLLFSAIGALQRCDALKPFIPKLVKSSNDQVVLLGVRAAFESNEASGCRTIGQLSSRFMSRRQPQIQDLVNRCIANQPNRKTK